VANGKLYALNVDGFAKLDGQLKRKLMTLKGQAKVVFDEMMSNRTPRSIPDIAKAVAGQLQTTQTDEKVVGYYVVSWRAQGVVYAVAGNSVVDTDVDAAFEKMFAAVLVTDESVEEDIEEDDAE
jgi:DNA-binding transcriptional regulator LsrR (DeoR family)